MDEAVKEVAHTLPAIAQQGDFGLVVILIIGGFCFLGFLAWLLVTKITKDAPTKEDLRLHDEKNDRDIGRLEDKLTDVKETADRTEAKLDTFITEFHRRNGGSN